VSGRVLSVPHATRATLTNAMAAIIVNRR
jgi:hypothetical protein